jgi:hypothetical protein
MKKLLLISFLFCAIAMSFAQTYQFVLPQPAYVGGAFTATGTLTLGTTTVGIDSFTTTGATKTVTITGAGLNDVYVITKLSPAYSTVIDSSSYSYTPAAGSVTVTRVKGKWAGATYKSGAQFSWLRIAH